MIIKSIAIENSLVHSDRNKEVEGSLSGEKEKYAVIPTSKYEISDGSENGCQPSKHNGVRQDSSTDTKLGD